MRRRPSDYGPDPDSEIKFRKEMKAEKEMEARGPAKKPDLWRNNEIQFARLIEEMQAAGAFTPALIDTLKDSMDLDLVDIHELMSRAQFVFDTSKAKLSGDNGEKDQKKFFHCVWTLADKLDIDDWDELVAPLVEMICGMRGWDYSKMLDENERKRK